MPPNNLAVLLIDMQPFFLYFLEKWRKYFLIENQAAVLRLCAAYDIPVAVLEFKGGGETISCLNEIAKRARRNSTFYKCCDDGFKSPELNETLLQWSINILLLMGINAPYCVKETAASALRSGYRIATAGDLIGNMEGDRTEYTSWYMRNGIYRPTYPELLKDLGFTY